jgi:hypothetical protein
MSVEVADTLVISFVLLAVFLNMKWSASSMMSVLSVPKRRDEDGKNVEPVVEVLSELPFPDRV